MTPETRSAWDSLSEAKRLMVADDAEASLQHLLEVAQVFRRAADHAQESHVLDLLGGVYNQLGNSKDAAEYHRPGLEAARR